MVNYIIDSKDGIEIYINAPLTSRRIVELMDKYPNMARILCPISLYKRTSPKYIEILKKLEIEVKGIHKMGPPRKYDEKTITLLGEKLEKGLSPQEIAQEMNLPLKTVYYLKNKNFGEKGKLKTGRKPKYDIETIHRIKNMKKEKLSAKEISEIENIPLRTVYRLLKKNI